MKVLRVIVKGVLPGGCYDCPFLADGEGIYCMTNGRDIDSVSVIPDWCPLVSMDDLNVDLHSLDGWIVEIPASEWKE
jgi:hypothetical protein